MGSKDEQAENMLRRRQPFWRQFKEAGFVTGYLDNECEDWNVKYTLRVDPTQLDHEVIAPFCQEEYFVRGSVQPRGPWVGPWSIRRRCLVGRYVHEYAFDYAEHFWRAYPGVPKFLFVGLIEAHEPSGEVIALVDTRLAAHLATLEASGALDHTAVVLFADHGLHMGYLFALKTEQAVRENRLPVCHLILPRALLDARQGLRKELKVNSQKLISSIDLHATFVDLAHWARGGLEAQPGLRAALQLSPSARSLLGFIEPGRTCADLGIPESFCDCVKRGD